MSRLENLTADTDKGGDAPLLHKCPHVEENVVLPNAEKPFPAIDQCQCETEKCDGKVCENCWVPSSFLFFIDFFFVI